MSSKNPKEFWIQNPQHEICTATRVSAFDSEVNSQITEEVHVIEYSAYQNALLEAITALGECNELLEVNELLRNRLETAMQALKQAAEYHNTDDVNGEAGYICWQALNDLTGKAN